MVSRALSFATVTLLVGCFAAGSAHAQATNLEAGKTPSQIFSGTCTVCHKSPRGLLKTVPASSLPGFLRQHYTTSSDMASVLASFLVSNGAADARYQAKDAPKQDPGKTGACQASRTASRTRTPGLKESRSNSIAPDASSIRRRCRRLRSRRQRSPTPMVAAPAGRKRRRTAGSRRQAFGASGSVAGRRIKPEDGQTPAQAAIDSKSGGKHKPGKRGRPGVEEPKTDEAKGNAAKEDAGKSETAKTETGKPEATKPVGENKSEAPKSETAKVDAPKESAEPKPSRPDPVPAVTPAPSTTTASGTPEPAASPAAPAPAAALPPPAPAAVTASAPPPPAAPSGPPTPPISQ